MNFKPRYNDRISFSISSYTYYSNQSTPDFSHYSLEFPKGNSAAQKLNRYNDNCFKNLSSNLRGNVLYFLDNQNNHIINFSYLWGNTLSMDLKFSSDFQIGLKASLDCRNSSSGNANFQTLNVYDYNYGISLQYMMPWKIQLSGDLTMYSRRGYSESYMNTNELVLNARLSRPICHGRLVLSVDAFDLLHNLTNVRYYVNAQGRSEQITNVIPSYAIIRLAYKLKGKSKENKAEME